LIIWLASYPKSGNTWVRSFLSSYYHSKEGEFDFRLLENIEQYPKKKFFNNKIEKPGDISKYWLSSQQFIADQKKIKIFKTHNSLHSINGYNFTDEKFTLGAVYIVRDPRNILTSLKNHFTLSYEDALDFMLNEKKYIYDNREVGYADFHFLSSWSNHYKSWLTNKSFKTIVIKYEDLENKTYETFKKLVVFIDQIIKSSNTVNDQKILKCIDSTNFYKLKKEEEEKGFNESIYSKPSEEKINFFHLGPENNWKRIVPKNFHDKIKLCFEQDLKFFNYK